MVLPFSIKDIRCTNTLKNQNALKITDIGQLFVVFYPYETGIWVGKYPEGREGLGR